ncbi:hypothetical protein S40293_10481 [Stachybotrys chartarum IBT 40293]|nr:hypothetical protein S40293_10481 [Stachybotrys chartarum IBT 40293]
MASPGPSPKPALLERMPLDVLELIAEALVGCDGSETRCSLFAFSLASRTCCAAATKQRFRYIHLAVQSEEQLRRDVDRWEALLQVHGRLGHVRIVKVTGRMSLVAPDEGREEPAAAIARPKPVITVPAAEERGECDDAWDPCRPPRELIVVTRVSTQDDPAETERCEKAWSPLHIFISKLPGLTDLVHACSDHISPGLLASLHQHHPSSRLHMHNFMLRSFCRAWNDERPVDPDDVAIITSPCLYSLVLTYKHWVMGTGYHDGSSRLGPYRINYNSFVVQKMLAGLSPRLTKVKLTHWRGQRPKGSPWTSRFFTAQWPLLESFFPPAGSTLVTTDQGHLRELSIPGCYRTTKWTINIIKDLHSESVNLRNLQSLTIRDPAAEDIVKEIGRPGSNGTVTEDVLKTLAIMGHNSELPSLSSLSLGIEDTQTSLSALDQATALMIRALPPLQSLSLIGSLGGKAISSVVDCGKSLQKLVFVPQCPRDSLGRPAKELFILSPSHAWAMKQKLTNLSDITLGITRTQGDRREVDIYQAIGSLPSLQNITLNMNFSPPAPTALRAPYVNPPNQIQDIRPGLRQVAVKGAGACDPVLCAWLRGALVNAAVDSILATDIFHTLTSEGSSLRRLSLRSERMIDGRYDSEDFTWAEAVMKWVSRDWTVKRDGASGEVTLTENNAKTWEQTVKGVAQEDPPPEVMEVWSDLWPPRTDQSWNAWSSFPLDHS